LAYFEAGRRIAILDLVRHQFEEARELYADVWLGFTELELRGFLKKAGSATSRPLWCIASRSHRILKRSSAGNKA